MPSATLRLSIDPQTGKRTVTISYASDSDALPHEHEDAHREVVEKLFETGMIGADDAILVEREGTGAAPAELPQGDAERQERKVREGT